MLDGSTIGSGYQLSDSNRRCEQKFRLLDDPSAPQDLPNGTNVRQKCITKQYPQGKFKFLFGGGRYYW